MESVKDSMRDWIAEIIDNVVANYNGRKVVLWGGA